MYITQKNVKFDLFLLDRAKVLANTNRCLHALVRFYKQKCLWFHLCKVSWRLCIYAWQAIDVINIILHLVRLKMDSDKEHIRHCSLFCFH